MLEKFCADKIHLTENKESETDKSVGARFIPMERAEQNKSDGIHGEDSERD